MHKSGESENPHFLYAALCTQAQKSPDASASRLACLLDFTFIRDINSYIKPSNTLQYSASGADFQKV